MNRFLIIYTTLLTIAQAQLLYEAPACAVPCINRYLTSTTCRSSVNVISCICQDRSAAAVELTNCVFDAQRCSPYDLAAFSEGLVQLCPEIFSSQAAPSIQSTTGRLQQATSKAIAEISTTLETPSKETTLNTDKESKAFKDLLNFMYIIVIALCII